MMTAGRFCQKESLASFPADSSPAKLFFSPLCGILQTHTLVWFLPNVAISDGLTRPSR
jgi:hypothetical protein